MQGSFRHAAALAALLIPAAAVSAEVTYDMTGGPFGSFVLIDSGQANPSLYQEVGDHVQLGGNPLDRKLESVTFIYANRSATPANALVDYQFNFYNVGDDGLPEGGAFYAASISGSNFTGHATTGYFRTVNFADTAPVLPDEFIITFEISNRRDNPDAAGDGMLGDILLYSSVAPPLVGSTPDGFVIRNASTGAFEDFAFTSGRQPAFRIETSMVPEPASLSALAGLGLLALRRRR